MAKKLTTAQKLALAQDLARRLEEELEKVRRLTRQLNEETAALDRKVAAINRHRRG